MNPISMTGSAGIKNEKGGGVAVYEKIYRALRSKAGAGLGTVFVILLLYLAVTLFTIYNLLASL